MADVALADLWRRAIARAPEVLPAAIVPADPSIVVGRVDHDSRQVRPGSLFCCVSGASFDGHEFAVDAVASGAVALVVERQLEIGVPQIVVDDVRAAMPWFASELAGNPSSSMKVVGLTGTNGKTTVTHLVHAIAGAAGISSRVLGTLSGTRTTPESTELQVLFAEFRDDGVELLAMEVSSHALEQHRVDGTDFAVAVFTNLSPDHLDYHESMDAYFAAKCRLFDGRANISIVNVDDEWGRRLAEQLADAGQDVITYELDDVTITSMAADRSHFVWRGAAIELPLGGAFNVANALAAAEVASALGVEISTIIEGLGNAPQIPGRMEVVVPPTATEPCVLVDYSHTPDGIDKVVATCRDLVDGGRLIIVFGAGGDRDRAKRPLMGRAASLADVVIVTSDNPRSEDPMTIIEEVLVGLPAGATRTVEPDRRLAIKEAMRIASPGDIVIVAGKGHESTQTIGTVAHPFRDASVVLETRRELGL